MLSRRIFEPLEMTHSFVAAPAPAAVPAATGYRLWFGVPCAWQRERSDTPDRHMAGAGGVWSSVEDLARYVEAVRARDPRIVPRDAQRMDATTSMEGNWGYTYGWFTHTQPGVAVFEHSGFTPGFLALATMVPASGDVVVVLTNMSGLAQVDVPRAITHQVLGWPQVPATPAFMAAIAIWSAVLAPLGLLLLLIKSVRQWFYEQQSVSRPARFLNLTAATALVLAAWSVYVGLPVITGVSFDASRSFYPDLTLTASATIAMALLVAAARAALVLRR